MAPSASMDALLQLHPAGLEQRFWVDADTRRMLCIVDAIAGALTLPKFCGALFLRVHPSLPGGVALPLGARAVLVLNLVVSLVPLMLMLTHVKAYTRWRLRLALANRVTRLCCVVLLTHPATVLGYLTQVGAVRKALSAGRGVKALLINTLMPNVSHMQHANFFVPFRLLLVLQAAIMGVALMWAAGMPCWVGPLTDRARASGGGGGGAGGAGAGGLPTGGAWLPAHHAPAAAAAGPAAEAAAAAAFQQAATATCQALQTLHALLLAQVASPLDGRAGRLVLNLSAAEEGVCAGVSAFQQLYLATAAVLLLVVPLASAYSMEAYAKRRFLRLQGIALLPAGACGAAAAPAGADGSGGGGGSGAAGSSRPASPRHSGGSAPTELQLEQMQLHTAPFMVCMCAILGPWVLADLLTTALGGQCSSVMASSHFVWLQNLY